jgi:hypothetical protein
MKSLTLSSTILTVAAAAVLMAVPVGVSASNSNSNAGNKVTICHATGSNTNPFVVISPNANGVINGHYGHQDARDIIPSFNYNDHGTTKTFAGQNLANGGQAVLDNGCKVPSEGGHGGGDGGNTTSTGGQVLGSTTVSANAVGAVAAGAGGANAFTLTSLNRVW